MYLFFPLSMLSASVEKSQIQEERLDDENHESYWDLSLNTLKTKTLNHGERDPDWTVLGSALLFPSQPHSVTWSHFVLVTSSLAAC